MKGQRQILAVLLQVVILFCLSFVPMLVYAGPVYEWHTFYGGEMEDRMNSIAVDKDGNIFITGWSSSSWNGNSGPFAILPKHAHSGTADIFVVKLDREGRYRWHTFYGSPAYDEGTGIAVDDDGNVYVAGRSDQRWEVKIGFLERPPRIDHSGGQDAVVLKLDANGNFLWHTFLGSAAEDLASGVAVDGYGNVLVSGHSMASWDGPVSSGGLLQAPRNLYRDGKDIFLTKLSSDGNYDWHTFYGSAQEDACQGIAVDNSGQATVVGTSDAGWNYHKLAMTVYPLHAHSGGKDITAVRVDAGGNYRWHAFYGSSGEDSGVDITTDMSGNVFMIGRSAASWLVGNSPYFFLPKNAYAGLMDFAIVKLDKEGAYKWHTFYGSNSSDAGAGIAVDRKNNIYVSGTSFSSWSPPQPIYGYHGGGDIALLSLSQEGSYRFHAFFGSDTGQQGGRMAADQKGNIIVGGISETSWNGPGGTLFLPRLPLHGITGDGQNDISILQCSQEGLFFPWNMFLPALVAPKTSGASQ